jgi:hypothetical protein
MQLQIIQSLLQDRILLDIFALWVIQVKIQERTVKTPFGEQQV